ncbi:MAG TPA: CHAP domain-containing protein [Actinokineospora sp.]|nr:CHAP domain-containing protein [Actinokineospora sp.]
MRQRKRQRSRLITSTLIAAISAATITVGTPAVAATNQFPVTTTLDGRTAKDLDNHAYPNKYPSGTVITVVCQDTGPATYGGSNIWDYTSDHLWVVDYYVKTGFSGFNPNVPRCDSNNSPSLDLVGTSYPVTATLDGRSAKDLNNHAYPDRYPSGSTINIVCQDSGPDAYGSSVWDYTAEGLWVTDVYVKTGFSGFSPNLQRCSDAGAPKTYGGNRFLVTATLDGRTAKDLNNHAYPDRYPAGSTVSVTCQAYGPEAYGSTVWDYTSDSLWVTDRYVKTGYSGFAPGIPTCAGSTPTQPPTASSNGDRARIVQVMQGQVGVYPEHNRDNCEPYATNFRTPYLCGEYQPWCAYFASWVWRQAGVWGANYGGSNQFYYWGRDRGLLRGFDNMKPGDAVLYGSGPGASVHIGLVESVLADGRITTIEGNVGDGVVHKSAFNPRNTGGQPIYAVVSPFDDGPGSGTHLPSAGDNQFPATATLDGRTAKDLANHAYPNKYPAGSLITVDCQDTGPNAYGSTIWDYTAEGLWVPDYYVKTGYSGFNPDLPRCSTGGTPPPQKTNPAYTEAMSMFFGSRLDLTRAVIPTSGGGSDSDLFIARAFIQGGDNISDFFVDHTGFSSKVTAPGRAMVAWEPKSGSVGLVVKPTCPGGTACKQALDIQNVGTTIPLGTECDGPVHPFCYAHYDYNKVGASGGGGAAFIRFQLADSYASVPGAGFSIPGAIDGYLNITKDSAGFHVNLTADQYPSWEIIRVPRTNADGHYETHMIGTRTEKTLKYLCTPCQGQATSNWVG